MTIERMVYIVAAVLTIVYTVRELSRQRPTARLLSMRTDCGCKG